FEDMRVESMVHCVPGFRVSELEREKFASRQTVARATESNARGGKIAEVGPAVGCHASCSAFSNAGGSDLAFSRTPMRSIHCSNSGAGRSFSILRRYRASWKD